MYTPRLIDKTLDSYLEGLPAILIEGAKGVGKTESCQRLAQTSYFMENMREREFLLNRPEQLLEDDSPILIDEWQLAPDLWTYVRRQVDRGMDPGRILFTGSSTKVHSRIHSGAGRIVKLQLRPFTIEERQMSDTKIRISELFSHPSSIHGKTTTSFDHYVEELFKSGLPQIRTYPSNYREIQLTSYIQNIINHDFEENGISIQSPQSVLAWLRAYAAAIATPTKYQTIIDTATAKSDESPSKATAQKYREALNLLYIIDEVPSFLGMGKIFNNLAKAPKHYMMDPAIALNLLNVKKDKLLDYEQPKTIGKFNRTFLGQLLESFVYQSLIVYADYNQAHLSHLRGQNGRREIDFILEKGRDLLLFEVKATPNVDSKSTQHLNWFEEQVKDEYNVSKVLLYTGNFAYTQEDGTHVIPISMLAD